MKNTWNSQNTNQIGCRDSSNYSNNKLSTTCSSMINHLDPISSTKDNNQTNTEILATTPTAMPANSKAKKNQLTTSPSKEGSHSSKPTTATFCHNKEMNYVSISASSIEADLSAGRSLRAKWVTTWVTSTYWTRSRKLRSTSRSRNESGRSTRRDE